MYYFDTQNNVFLNSMIHKEVKDESSVDTTIYIPVTDAYFKECIDKRSLGYYIFSKENKVLVSDEPCPSAYHKFVDGQWVLTDEDSKRKNRDELQTKLDETSKQLSTLKINVAYESAMQRPTDNLIKNALDLESEIVSLKEQIANL